MERQLIRDYEHTLDELLTGLNHDSYEVAVEIASIPEQIRGYGHIKEANTRGEPRKSGKRGCWKPSAALKARWLRVSYKPRAL